MWMVYFRCFFLACITQSVSFPSFHMCDITQCVYVDTGHQCYLLFQLLLVIYLPCILDCSKTELDYIFYAKPISLTTFALGAVKLRIRYGACSFSWRPLPVIVCKPSVSTCHNFKTEVKIGNDDEFPRWYRGLPGGGEGARESYQENENVFRFFRR